jgi:hypothetical protein
MSATVLLILAIGLAALFIVRLRSRLALLAAQVKGLRAQALVPLTYAPTTDRALDAVLASATKEAEALGFTMLGDHVETSELATAPRAMRWFVDRAGTTFGWIAPFEVHDQHFTVIVLMSHELDTQTVTSRQPAASLLARPPFVDVLAVPPPTSFAETLAKHRKRAQLDDQERAFVPAKTADEVFAEVARMRDKVIAWRRAQPADELLDADLRSLLGAQYDKLVGPLRRRLGD